MLASCPQIWALGNLDILTMPFLGFFCATRCPGNAILRTYDLALALREAGVPGDWRLPYANGKGVFGGTTARPATGGDLSCPQYRASTHANELA